MRPLTMPMRRLIEGAHPMINRVALFIMALLAAGASAQTASPLAYPGKIVVFPPGASAKGCIELPDGTFQNPSSKTDCLQEAINQMVPVGAGLAVVGGAANYTPAATIRFPPLQGYDIVIDNATIAWTSVGDCIDFDSMMMVDFTVRGGQVVCSGVPIRIKPVNPVPIDKVVVAIDFHFHITTLVNSGKGQFNAAIVPDISGGGPIVNGSIDIDEANFDNGVMGVYVPSGAAANVLEQVRITIMHLHGAGAGSTAGILLGTNKCAPEIADNIFTIGEAVGPNVRGIDNYGAGNIFIGSIIGPSGASGAVGVLDENCPVTGNKYLLTRLDGGHQEDAPGTVFY